MPKKHSGYVRRIPDNDPNNEGTFERGAHSFGQLVEPNNAEEAVDYGYAVKLHCQCMDPHYSATRNPDRRKPWARNEFERLTKKEYELLVRYHDETCKIHKLLELK